MKENGPKPEKSSCPDIKPIQAAPLRIKIILFFRRGNFLENMEHD
jgi:hypothetical protein